MSEGECLAAEVAVIAALDLDGLRTEWARRYGAPPPLRSVPIMASLLAWRIQADARGGIGGETRRVLARKGRLRAEGLELGIGARLTRQWQGRSHEVLVEAGGFRWEGQLYKSLSAAATAIAGSRWNGPRFFGLRDAA
ncbi:MAG: DUF2924 domain-containing protein [Sphingomonadales bacterium]|nr:DUF2924 domain-containing protein [Sphingomonadales bacterium]MBU3991643.1 DUF2924 domain-containing protein [Alphaproteobacteria bacterium]